MEHLSAMDSGLQLLDRVSLIAIGVENYLHLEPLPGPGNDIRRLKKLLIDDPTTAVIPQQRSTFLENPDSASVRKCILEYVLARSAPNDILVLYFSGHAARVGNNDLGLCTTDTYFHRGFGHVPPLGVVRFGDIIETVASSKVDPVIILDACYSGTAIASVQQIYDQLKRQVQAEVASNYALLCSSRSTEESTTLFEGGVFSETLFRAAKTSIEAAENRRKPWLSLQDLYSAIRKDLEKNQSSNPLLFVGSSLPAFPFVKNPNFEPRSERFTPSHKASLEVFWNNGHPIDFETNELMRHGPTVYTTHAKLCYAPAWALLEQTGKTKRLSARGREFIHGRLKIPLVIVKDELTQEWNAAPGSIEVAIDDIGAP
jgi:hypothetical protein